MFDQDQMNRHIAKVLQRPYKIQKVKPISGGCINQTYELISEQQCFFVKFNQKAMLPMFEAEFAGLQEMQANAAIKVPGPIVCGVLDELSFLLLERLQFGVGSQHSSVLMGQQLAEMHLAKQPYFGWRQDNTIGSTPQLNNNYKHWVDFWRDMRLGFQLKLAEKNGYAGQLQKNGAFLCANLEHFFTEYQPYPALLHGDLWSGNAATDLQGNPVIFDPACYYGDHETDLAMTELFGGFGADFYAAYADILAIDAGYSVRKTLYNLYHILNHLNLFGAGYLSQAEGMMARLLAELK